MGVGEKMHFVPLTHIGVDGELQKAYLLRGYYVTSNLGSPPSALNASPDTLQLHFYSY